MLLQATDSGSLGHKGVAYCSMRAILIYKILEVRMPWYIWLLIALVLGSIVASLMLLRSTANKMPISAEKLELMRQRNAELEAQERQQDQ